MATCQTNTIVGSLTFCAGENLTGKECRLLKLAPAGVTLAGVADLPLYVCEYGAAAGGNADCCPLEPGRQFRVSLAGACARGDRLYPAAAGQIAAAKDAGATVLVGVAEEAGEDGQDVLVRIVNSLL